MTLASASVSAMRDRFLGIACVLAAAFSWSLAGVFIRLLSTDLWTTVAWRALAGAVFVAGAGLLIPGAMSPASWRAALRPAGLAIIVCQITGQVTFVAALYRTSVANVCIIGATLPVFAAVLSRIYLKEAISLRTVLAAALCLVGVSVVFSASTQTGNLTGDLLSIVMVFCFAVVIVIPRAHGEVPILPTAAGSALLTFFLFVPLSSASMIGLLDWAVLAAYGATSFCLGVALYLAGAKRLSPSETALIGTAEVVLAPLWVWIMFAEIPSRAAFLGGGIVLATLLALSVSGFYRRNQVVPRI